MTVPLDVGFAVPEPLDFPPVTKPSVFAICVQLILHVQLSVMLLPRLIADGLAVFTEQDGVRVQDGLVKLQLPLLQVAVSEPV